MDEGGFGVGKRVGLVAGPVLLAITLAFPPPPGMAPEAWRLVGVILLMGAWWMTEAIPMGATSLVPILLFPFLGILAPAATTAAYAEPAVFLFLGGFLLAKGFERSGLHRRVALMILARVGRTPRQVLFGFMLATALMSMWVSNTATAMMMLPIGAAVAAHTDAGARGSRWRYPFPTVLMLGIAYAASIGGMATLIGTPPNIIFAGQAATLTGGAPVGFVQWMIVGVPLAAAFLVLAWAWLAYVAYDARKDDKTRFGGAETVRSEIEALGPLRRAEALVLTVFLSTVALWVFRVDIDLGGLVVPGWSTALGLDVHDATIAIGAGLLLFLLPTSLSRGEFVLDWPTAAKLPWDVLLLFGGGFALAAGFQATQLGDWVALQVTGVAWLPLPLLIGALAIIVVLASEVASNTALTGLLLPVLAASAPALGVAPLTLMLAATLAASSGFMLPVATPPNAVAYASGHVRIHQMARVGLALDVIGVVLVTLAVLGLADLALA